jgi:N-acetylglucosaminyldiphosphoundecaprenol N-acetyl-beta-D-mannosaminyltransferase
MKLEDVQHTFVGGIKTACITHKDSVKLYTKKIRQCFTSGIRDEKITPLVVFDTNGHALALTGSNKEFLHALKQADLIHADGQSIVTLSFLLCKDIIPERTATTDTIHEIPMLYKEDLRHFLLGGEKQVVERCANILASRYGNFKIAGTRDGFFSEAEEDEVIAQINAAEPDILWVGLGKPKEQLFIIKNKHKINVPVVITCGGCYNFISGDYTRAPQWMQEYGLEWLYRLLKDPKKLFWRYLSTNPLAMYYAIKYRNKQEWR